MMEEYAIEVVKNNAVLPRVSNTICECIYEYNDDHHGLLVWQCPKCEAEEKQAEAVMQLFTDSLPSDEEINNEMTRRGIFNPIERKVGLMMAKWALELLTNKCQK